MLFEIAKSKVDNIPNGRIFKVELMTSQNSKLNANAKKNGITVEKHSFNVCRKGIEYSNTNYIKALHKELNYQIGERANGKKDSENKGFADSKLGNKLLDLFSMTCIADRMSGNTPISESKVEFIVNNNGVKIVVDYKTLEEMGIMQPSFFTKSDKNKEKYAKMLEMKAEWERDKENYPQENKEELAKLIRDMYNKMFSVKVENIVSIGE